MGFPGAQPPMDCLYINAQEVPHVGNKGQDEAAQHEALRSQFVTLIVERGADGHPRLVLEGASMAASGFEPGDTVEAIIQPDLVSILRLD